jgi:prepilin-type N-terminal cleavage/methylation domain-containing protein
MTVKPNTKGRGGEAGFTLVEVLIAVVVLSFGLMAIANLFAMSTSSNVAARHLTAATTQATEVAEMLKAVPFSGLTPGGPTNIVAELDWPSSYQYGRDAATGKTLLEPVKVDLNDDNVVDVYDGDRFVEGVGTIRVRWQIARVDDQTRLIHIVAASATPLLTARSRVEFLTYRSCTGPRIGCPNAP